MDILILGYSTIARRRALPALMGLTSIGRIDIASRHGPGESEFPAGWRGTLYRDYHQALAESPAQLVYISTATGEHHEWAQVALSTGRHVVVDKPAFLGLNEAEAMVRLAAERGCALGEATVYDRHPQFDTIHALQKEMRSAHRVAATFSFPPLAEGNFRIAAQPGAGALCDLGPYAAGICRFVFGRAPVDVFCRITARHEKSGIDTAFTVCATFPNGANFIGQFGFDTEYQNRVIIAGSDYAVEMERAFTIPPTIEGQLTLWRSNQKSIVVTEPGDTFARFFDEFIQAAERGNSRAFTDALTLDARMLQMMRDSAKGAALS